MSRLKNTASSDTDSRVKIENFISSPNVLGTALAYSISLLVFVLSSLLFAYTPLPETVLPYLTYLTSIVSVLVGGIYAGGKTGHKGWKNGGIIGILYFVGLFLLSFFLGVQIVFGLQLFARAVLAFVIGAIGGIIGVNLR